MKAFKKAYKTAICAGFALLLSALPQQALGGFENVALRYDIEQPRAMALKYDVYAGGFKALNATLDLDLDKKAYDMALAAKTEGFIGNLFPWKAVYSTSGYAHDGALIPAIHTARSTWRDKVKLTEMNYDPSGNLMKTTTQEGSKTTVNRDIKKSLADDSVDMLTGALLMFQAAKNTDKCEGTFPVFDGKRRYNITLKSGGADTIKASKYSSFSGEALRCSVKVEPVAGFKKKDAKRGWMAVQAHTEERNKPPTLWLARIEKDGPVVPVRMEIASAYGTVVAHLTGSAKE